VGEEADVTSGPYDQDDVQWENVVNWPIPEILFFGALTGIFAAVTARWVLAGDPFGVGTFAVPTAVFAWRAWRACLVQEVRP